MNVAKNLGFGFLMVACGGAGETGQDSNDVTSTSKYTSAYTDMDPAKCEQVGDESVSCKGQGGFEVGLGYPGDGKHVYLSLSKTGAAESIWLNEGIDKVLPEAPIGRSFGTKAEWRIPMSNPKAPFSFSVRVIDELANGRTQHHLAVFKIQGDKACLFGIVEASKQAATANVLARSAMDRAREEACPSVVVIK